MNDEELTKFFRALTTYAEAMRDYMLDPVKFFEEHHRKRDEIKDPDAAVDPYKIGFPLSPEQQEFLEVKSPVHMETTSTYNTTGLIVEYTSDGVILTKYDDKNDPEKREPISREEYILLREPLLQTETGRTTGIVGYLNPTNCTALIIAPYLEKKEELSTKSET